MIINEILELTPAAFTERHVATVAPDPNGPYPHGLHTLSAVGDLTLVDGNRKTFRPQQLLRAAQHFFRRVQRHRRAN